MGLEVGLDLGMDMDLVMSLDVGGCFRKEEGYGFGVGDMLVDWVCDEDNNSPSLMVEPFISPTAYYVVNL